MSSTVENICISCGVKVENDSIGVRCLQGHDICSECSPKFAETILEDPLASLQAKCSVCQTEIPSLTFERQLNEFQLQIYNLYMIQNKLDPTEETRGCPHCKYFEI